MKVEPLTEEGIERLKSGVLAALEGFSGGPPGQAREILNDFLGVIQSHEALRAAIRAKEGEVGRLRGALEKYGGHLGNCNTFMAWGEAEHPCDCGLNAALRPPAEGEEE